MKLLDFLSGQKRIYAKLTPKIQAHDRVTEIGTCLKKQVPIFLICVSFCLFRAASSMVLPFHAGCWAFQVLGQLEYFNQRDELLFGELVIINAKIL
ncbi:MAG: hypothetical protein Q3X19_05645 [Oscillospiraceae bacterium]|nr:hypothetical protein [Oscillospiraceae bacterium]